MIGVGTFKFHCEYTCLQPLFPVEFIFEDNFLMIKGMNTFDTCSVHWTKCCPCYKNLNSSALLVTSQFWLMIDNNNYLTIKYTQTNILTSKCIMEYSNITLRFFQKKPDRNTCNRKRNQRRHRYGETTQRSNESSAYMPRNRPHLQHSLCPNHPSQNETGPNEIGQKMHLMKEYLYSFYLGSINNTRLLMLMQSHTNNLSPTIS